jgi:cytochrome c2
MLKLSSLITLALLLSACSEKPINNLNGEKLIEQKCSSCHNLELPPKTYEDEQAPPMMAVAFHVKSFIQTENESQRIPKAKEFVKDYVFYPAASKAFCDKGSLKSYGVMPSQKGKLTDDELDAIATYMFEHFTQENLTKEQAIRNRLAAMPKGELLAIKNNCLNCHRKEIKLVGPSFNSIAIKYKNSPQAMKEKIINSSRHFPTFKKLTNSELDELVSYISH